MTTEDAVYCLAHQEGFALEEYLPAETVDRVRELLRALGTDREDQATRRSAPRGAAKARELVLAGGIRLPDPILPNGILEDASKMATTAYPMFYVFENSLRYVIATMMGNEFGEDWWTKGKIRGLVEEGKRQERAKRCAKIGVAAESLIRFIPRTWRI